MANHDNNTITETTTLFELLDILSPLVKPAKRPTPLWLRKNAKPIAEHSQIADSKPHLSMNATLYDNGYGIYSSDGHTTVVWLADCLDIVYRFGFSTSGEREADQTRIDRDVLGNLPWFQAFVLRGEAQISSAIERNLRGLGELDEDSENPESLENVESAAPCDNRQKKSQEQRTSRVRKRNSSAKKLSKKSTACWTCSQKVRLKHTGFITGTG